MGAGGALCGTREFRGSLGVKGCSVGITGGGSCRGLVGTGGRRVLGDKEWDCGGLWGLKGIRGVEGGSWGDPGGGDFGKV